LIDRVRERSLVKSKSKQRRKKMYFAFGWPKTYASGIGDTFVDVAHNVDGTLLALLSATALSVWSGDQHRVHLGYIIRSEDSINKFGRNERLTWCPDSSAIAIVTSLGYILVYIIERDYVDVMQLRFRDHHHNTSLDKRRVAIKFSSSFKPSTLGAICITGNAEYIFIFTREGYLVRSSWTGELISQFSLDIVPFDDDPTNPATGGNTLPKAHLIVASVHYTSAFPTFGLVFEGAGDGTTNGAKQHEPQDCQLLRTFSLFQFREVTPDEIGPISKMSWTSDGNCLAVGWRNRGLCIWSVYGCKLTCTIPQMHDGASRFAEPCREGVLSFSWGPEGYHLILLSSGNEPGEFLQLTFLKASLSANPNLNYSERIILQTEDRLMLLNYKGKELGDIRWKHLQIPSIYLNDNWPIKHIALSRDRSQLAVAGRKGVILYNSLSKRWKMFGDRTQEQEIESLGLTWYKHTIIIANQVHIDNGKRHEFLVYPKQHLDQTSLHYKGGIPGNQTPLLIDCNDAHLALLTSESFFYLYRISEQHSPSSLDMTIIHVLSMAIPSPPLSISLLPPIQVPTKNPATQSTTTPTSPRSASLRSASSHVYCLILHTSGRLVLSNAENAAQIELSQNVEQYWFTNIYRERDIIGNTLWGYGLNGIQVWFPFSSEEIHASRVLHHNRSLSFDNEVYPIGFLSELGVIVGLSQGISYNSCSQYPCYDIHIKTHPFLHSILKHLLERGGAEKAWSLSSKFYTIPHFTHSLELLLHETISENDIKRSTKLEYVVNFLQRFPQFPEVSMRCARKIDASLWKHLFNYIGDPVALYQKCLAGGKIEIAASYLKILQVLESNEFSRKCAIEMLEIVLDFDNMDLAGDLVRFMEPEEDEEEEQQHDVNDDNNKVPKTTALTPQQRLQQTQQREKQRAIERQQVDFIISSYASKLLKNKLLRNFLLFSRKVGTPITQLLATEKKSTILRTAEELDMALNAIHVQFYISAPVDDIPPFSPAAILTGISTTLPSPTSSTSSQDNVLASSSTVVAPMGISNSNSNSMRSSNGMDQMIGELNLEGEESISRYEMIESLKSRIHMTSSDHPLVSSSSSESISNLANMVSGGNSALSAAIYSFKSHQFMIAPSATNFDVNDPSFLQDSIDSSMDDLYFLLQELTNAACHEWVLVIGTVLLNPALITKILRKIPNIYENYCKMLSHQKPQGYSQLLKFIEDTVHPLLQGGGANPPRGGGTNVRQ
ncbi:hypothetical protein SAMD00019534_081180, partial [Acytostelium subglobosum LB1]|uniref:hypothetical protein n=1 Tax=Acytostelium subglobosum LB1 TaxID=1410327 RepID=UPI000644FACE